eukprot:scaffold15811_cov48-Prasinocladus_malaysianus.AAC.1
MARFNEARRHLEKNGRVWPEQTPDSMGLVSWLRWQRYKYRTHKLNPRTMRLMDRLEMPWETTKLSDWDKSFQQLADFHRRHSTRMAGAEGLEWLALHTYQEDPEIGAWVLRQRKSYARGNLAPEHASRLEKLPAFTWAVISESWVSRYRQLLDGHGSDREEDDTPDHVYKETCMGRWMGAQRSLYRRGALEEAKVQLLEQAGIEWDTSVAVWTEMYDKLLEFHSKYGHCRVPHPYHPCPDLPRWVNKQRQALTEGTLNEQELQALGKLHFADDPDLSWMRRFHRLREFVKETGHTNVPKDHEAQPEIGSWMQLQRRAYRQGRLDQTKINMLEGLGFQWVAHDSDWQMHYHELRAPMTT